MAIDTVGHLPQKMARGDFLNIFIWAVPAFLILLFLPPIRHASVTNRSDWIRSSNPDLARANPRLTAQARKQVEFADRRAKQWAAIKTPTRGESVEFEMPVFPEEWSQPIVIPRDYHLAAEIIADHGVRVWRSTNGNTNNQTVMAKAAGAAWSVWSESFVKIYNPLSQRMPYMNGPWANSVQFKSAETFPVRIHILLEPARRETTFKQQEPRDRGKTYLGATSRDIHTFDLKTVAYHDALQVLRQDWPRETFGFFDAKTFYGDMTKDGSDEAAVWVRYRLSGEASTPSLSDVFIYTVKDGQIGQLARLKGGDRAYGGIESVKIQGGYLVLGRYQPETPTACMACYGFIETTDYLWNGNGLASTAVRVSKIERKSPNTSVQPNQETPQESVMLAGLPGSGKQDVDPCIDSRSAGIFRACATFSLIKGRLWKCSRLLAPYGWLSREDV